MLSLIVAMGKNHIIGKDNKIPWHLPNDLRYFKEKTTGHTIVMGRKTFESLGGLLPNRKHIVLTCSQNAQAFPKEVVIVNNIEAILDYEREHHNEEIFVIGGGQLYKQMLPHADRLYITLIDETFEGDVFFPEINEAEWKLISKEKGIKDENNRYDYYFLVYER